MNASVATGIHRLDRIDMLRAAAMLWMTVYHFCFDLNYHGLLREDFYQDPFWTWQRTAIVSLFLFTAGLSQAVALNQGQGWARFWRRWAKVAGGALLVSLGSWLMFPNSFIYFGILHGIAVMLVVARLTAGWGAWLWPAGALAISMKWVAPWVIGAVPSLGFLDLPGFNALGFISRLPVTEDYAPLLPWLGVVWWGVAAGRWAVAHRPAWLGADDAAPTTGIRQFLAGLGRWSLPYYLVHQPVMLGLVSAYIALSRTVSA
ncbi:MAG TPA: heparan-alpha-glucosaminide N-acetyltransferase [Hydrogenophaga sp.]